ncbi:BnaC09g38750D [Brassica napus]|uniref:BnaC09g38750D protein n=1 Tax=Brassica napus TaxID=3708 RepID=A0A078FLF5_BRANA|nr:BnaC09g38750D [Brassica napus]
MSTLATFHPLTKLRPFKNKWRVQVKCLHSWRQNTLFGDTFEMVLADQWVNYHFYIITNVFCLGNKIQASCKRTHMAKVQRALPLGKWGVIENVQMNPAGGKYRTTRHPYKMAISDETVIRGSDLADDRIFLSLSNYESIGKTDKKEFVYLIDVIGRVHDLGDVLTVKAQGEDRKRVEFRLVDSHLSAAHSQLATVEKSTGKKDGKRIQYDWNDAEIKPISEIMDATKMKRIDKPKFHCEICNAIVTHVSPKFKLHVVVKDDTETCSLMLLGSVAKSIVGVKVDDLWDGSYGEIEDPEILPEPIRNLVGKSFCFGVSINSENVSSGSATFLVLEVCSGDKVVSIESGYEAISEMGTTSSTMSSGGVLLLDSSSSEDPKTPYSKRKEDDADLPDLTSTSKKLCTKVIKQEKAKTD